MIPHYQSCRYFTFYTNLQVQFQIPGVLQMFIGLCSISTHCIFWMNIITNWFLYHLQEYKFQVVGSNTADWLWHYYFTMKLYLSYQMADSCNITCLSLTFLVFQIYSIDTFIYVRVHHKQVMVVWLIERLFHRYESIGYIKWELTKCLCEYVSKVLLAWMPRHNRTATAT